MPDTATHIIDSVIDGQIYIGKCVFLHLARSLYANFRFIFIDTPSPYLTVLLPPSPSTSVVNLALRT